ncbi:heat shock 70 kDa protein 8-like [Trifolium pratense]|uniref:heat shock 70 kDa protein 8-like n=1 Tax=Trifolium pratense TaxID=57577 RepID=UPI001E69455E|nr:heat shock 70 kDa protein 8-like [Trifolium pratense]
MTEPAASAESCTGNTICTENTEEESSSLPPDIAIGIDIGTTPCCVSVWNGPQLKILTGNMNEMMKKCFETSKDHDFSIGASSSSSSSTEVSLENENMNQFFNIIFSERAKLPFLMHTVDIEVRPFVAAFMKKLWKSTTAVELLGKFLTEIRSIVETRLNKPIRMVVFTVPVSFSRLQVNRIYDACAMADLKVIRLMLQPIAVALWYVIQQYASSDKVMDNESKKIALVFNMDAGYCDVSVIEAEREKLRIKAMTGSTIGVEDLLGNMMCHLLPDSEEIFKRPVHWNSDILPMAFLRSGIHNLITNLSTETSDEVDLESIDGLKIQRVVTRNEFEDVNKKLFEKCENLIYQCLQDAKIEAENITDIIIVGGCCNIPRVKNLVTEICNGKEIYEGIDPLDAVLYGAALAGAHKMDSVTSQVTLHAIGIQCDGVNFVPVIPKNTSLPTVGDMVFSTIDDNQTTASIVVCEGVEEGQNAEENNVLGNFKITEIPEAPKGVPEITVSMSIDRKSILTITAYVGMPRFTPVVTNFDDQFLIRTYDYTINLS